ncbi:PA14 domain-containing protein [Candidatus Chlorohelix sp.]|uniref:PA14 domain-containing protein n=1 Tax=Candidatus Chlorohelix sp. TaxID=3139201 RepID=UPI003024FE7D
MKNKRIVVFGLFLMLSSILIGLIAFISSSDTIKTQAATPASNVLTINNSAVKHTFSSKMLGVNMVNWEHAWGKPYPGDVTGLAQALKAAKIGLIRYGGGNWTNTLGWDRTAERTPYTGWPNATNGPYWFQFNPREIDSLAKLAQLSGADVLIEVNVSTNNPTMWADMVKYTNVEHNYKFKYWEIGNELDLASSTPSPDEYVTRLGQYTDAMMSVDPTISITASAAASPYEATRLGYNDTITTLSQYLTKPYTMVSPKGNKIKALSYHWYQACNSVTAADLQLYQYSGLATNSWRNNYSRIEADLMPLRVTNEITHDSIPQGVTELNFDACNYDNPMNGNFLNALWTTDVLGRMAYNGADFATRWEGYGTQGYGMIYPNDSLNPTQLYARPAYYAYLMYANYFGDQMVESSSNDNARLSVWASRDSTDTTKLKLMVTNLSANELPTTLNTTGFTAGSGSLYQLRSAKPADISAASLTAPATINGVSVNMMDVAGSLNGIKPVALAVSGSSFNYTFPAYSTTAIILTSGNVISTPTPTATAIPTATATPNPTTTAPVATATPTPSSNTPIPTATATATAGGQSITTSVTTSKTMVNPGQAVTLNTIVKAGSSAATWLVDTEIYCSTDKVNWTKDFQNYRDSQKFTAGQTLSYADTWNVPSNHATAQCVIKVGLFLPGWSSQVMFSDVGTIAVGNTSPPTNTPTPVPTTPTGTVGTGLKGEYFDNVDFTNLKLTRVDKTVNFNWGNGSPDSSIGVDTFSVRWSGQVLPQFSETYTFYTQSDDGVRLWVNGQLLVDNWTNHASVQNSGTIQLTAGQKYYIRMEYYDNRGSAIAKLSWSSPSQSKQIIPVNRLFPAAG